MSPWIYWSFNNQEFSDPELAAKAAEARGQGCVVRFRREPNRYGALVSKSCGMWTYEDGRWQRMSIYSGLSEPMGEQRPQ